MTTFRFRQAKPVDIPIIFAFDPFAAQGDQGRQEFIRRAVAEHACIVAVVDNTIAGYAVLEYTFFGCGFISMVYVHSDYRRRQIGDGLFAYLEQACATPKLFTSTNLSNLPTQLLLNKRGYLLSGVIHHLDENDPELIYFKQIGLSETN